jgi:hypothetical protein
MTQRAALAATVFIATLLFGNAVRAQDADADAATDNGTDPSRVSSTASVYWERVDLRGSSNSDTLMFQYITPLSPQTKLTFKLPLVRNDTLGNTAYGRGDGALALTHVYTRTKTHGIVLIGELAFNSAGRDELGSGKHVFKGTYIHARFLQDGSIVAPALVHSISVGGDGAREKVNRTVFDFYYVPKLADPKVFMTFDPALNYDWEADKSFAGLAVTVGYLTGPAFGGRSQVYIKPAIFGGADRPYDWAFQIGYKVIGF